MANIKRPKGKKVRITGIKGTQKITRVMKMVAPAKLVKRQDKINPRRGPMQRRSMSFLLILCLLWVRVLMNCLNGEIGRRDAKGGYQRTGDLPVRSIQANIIRYGLTYANELGKTAKVVVVGELANDSLLERKHLNIIKVTLV
ncbi:MAG: F0F1 ATP synthase subunit gamma [Ignavibacteria bacterium]|nr:F0F1 ATP synthase subunit gamma [Ignavibacteria bacterium]